MAKDFSEFSSLLSETKDADFGEMTLKIAEMLPELHEKFGDENIAAMASVLEASRWNSEQMLRRYHEWLNL